MRGAWRGGQAPEKDIRELVGGDRSREDTARLPSRRAVRKRDGAAGTMGSVPARLP